MNKKRRSRFLHAVTWLSMLASCHVHLSKARSHFIGRDFVVRLSVNLIMGKGGFCTELIAVSTKLIALARPYRKLASAWMLCLAIACCTVNWQKSVGAAVGASLAATSVIPPLNLIQNPPLLRQ
jgi:hypothetical protein